MPNSRRLTKKQTFGQWLHTKRLERGIGLRAFAELIDEQPSNLCGMERSSRSAPRSVAKINAIADSLQVPRDEVCAAAGILPPDIETTLVCNPILWAKVRKLYTRGANDAE